MSFFQKNRVFTDSDPVTNNPDATLYASTVTISSAAILTSFTTPIVLIPAVAKTIVVESCLVRTTFGIAYLTNQSGTVYADTCTVAQFSGSKILGASLTGTVALTAVPGTGTATDTQYKAGKDIVYKTSTGNPDTGISTLEFILTYRFVS